MMFTKVHEGNIKQLGEKGEGIAVISTLGVIDRDGDVTLPAAFGEQIASVVYAHDWSRPPVGKATIREEGNEALAHFRLNLKTEAGKEVYEALKFDIENGPPKGQWSYGFSIQHAEPGMLEDQHVRFLKKLKVHEVSPVLLGSGVDTRTVAMKGVWLTAGQVKLMCPPCAEKMRERHITKIKLSELIKQGFTCPKPFASFQECVDRFSGEADVDDPEAFCAAWEAACGERGADGDGQKTMAGQMASTMADMEALVKRLSEIHELRIKEGRDFSAARKEEIAKVKELLQHLDGLLTAPEKSADAVRRYFDLKAKTIKGLDPR